VDATCVALLDRSERLRAYSNALAMKDVALFRACDALLAQAAALHTRAGAARSLTSRSALTPRCDRLP
jgi:hypothetical protein